MPESGVTVQSPVVCYRIGEYWLLNTHTNRLTYKDRSIELEGRLVLLLVYLIEHAGEVVHKDVLLKEIWSGKVVNEDSVAVAISYLRKALGDSPRIPVFIKTIQGKGYQFIGKAEPVSDNSLSVVDKKLLSKKYRFISSIAAGLMLLLALAYGTKMVFSSAGEYRINSAEWKKDFHAAHTLLAKSDSESLRTAIKQLRHMLTQYGESADVYLGIADAKIRLLNEKLTLKENCIEIIDLTQKALSLEPKLASAHKTAANMAFWCRRDMPAAGQYYLQALKLNPNDDSVLMNYAQFLLALERFDESLAMVEQARRLNPVNYSVPNVVWIYQMQGRDDLAQRELNRILTTEPDDRYYHISAKRIYERRGDISKTFEQWQWLMRDAGFSDDKIRRVQREFEAGGLVAVNQWLLNQKITADLGDYSPPLAWGRYALVAKDYDTALGFLEAAFEQRQPALLWVNIDPAYDSVRDTPRFQQLLARIKQVETY